MSKYFRAKIISNASLGSQFRLLSISPLSDVFVPSPGQFYMLQVGNTNDPLLKRPFSIFEYSNGIIKFLYRIRGKGTFCLSRFKKGDVINAVGPLGNVYPSPNGDFIAIAGGIGIASLHLLLENFKNRAYLFYGARNKDELIMIDDFRSLSKELFLTTDDGSIGQKGLATEVLSNFLNQSRNTHCRLPIYACGPLPMLKELSRVINNIGHMSCYVSLEEHMACGVGACLGCVMKSKAQGAEKWIYKRVCKEGPVFDMEEIIWE